MTTSNPINRSTVAGAQEKPPRRQGSCSLRKVYGLIRVAALGAIAFFANPTSLFGFDVAAAPTPQTAKPTFASRIQHISFQNVGFCAQGVCEPVGGRKCAKLGTSPLCWQENPVSKGVSQYTFDGKLDGQAQRIQLLRVDPKKAHLRVQHARGVYYNGEHPREDRLPLDEIAPRIPGTVAAISGGYFHFNPPQNKGEYYLWKWDGKPFGNGDPIGELYVDRHKYSANPSDKQWASFRIAQNGQISFSRLPSDDTVHSLGGAPLLIEDGRVIDDFGTPLTLQPPQIATPGEFRYHMNAAHGRTGVCQDRSNHVFLVVAEGRMPGATGFRMNEFGRFLRTLDCENALNLDGGGSVDLVRVNPQGRFESSVRTLDPQGRRPISTAILVQSSLEDRVDTRLVRMNEEGRELVKKVADAVENGGRVVHQPGNSGIYKIKDQAGRTLAIFKPEDERAWGPANREPTKREKEPTEEDIHQLRLSGFHQGRAAQRQQFARTLDDGPIEVIPKSAIIDLTSDQFFNPAAEGAKEETKRGFLQEWVEDAEPLPHGHPLAQRYHREILPRDPNAIFPDGAMNIHENPQLDQVPLDEFQKVALMNTLLYNQDGHAGNYLIRQDGQGNLHLISVDMDTTLPYQLSDLVGLSHHQRARQPFTRASREFIAQLEPNYVRRMAERMGLPFQSCINAKVMALVLRKFSQANLTLADVHRLISNQVINTPSPLWNIMERCKQKAIDQLPRVYKNKYLLAQTDRWALWNEGGRNAEPGARARLDDYNLHFRDRIEQAIDQVFWQELDVELDQVIRTRL